VVTRPILVIIFDRNAHLRQKDKEANVDERPLTDAQKAAIAEVRQVFTAKTAEREILHLAALRTAATREEVELLSENLRRDLERLTSDRDRKIGEIRARRLRRTRRSWLPFVDSFRTLCVIPSAEIKRVFEGLHGLRDNA
jgi:LmbE family N-acetylglucosaminyl deacetylase